MTRSALIPTFSLHIKWVAFILITACSTANTHQLQEIGRDPGSATVTSNCRPSSLPVTEGDIECLTKQLIEAQFPELQEAWASGRIEFRNFSSKSYFFKTSFRKGILRRKKSYKTYSIDINPKIFDPNQKPNGPPSVLAIEGILAHELMHLIDYETLSPSGMARFGASFLVNPSKIERSTDKRAFERGFALGIKDYRIWIYGKLKPSALQVKRRRYYTPEEIDEWLLGR